MATSRQRRRGECKDRGGRFKKLSRLSLKDSGALLRTDSGRVRWRLGVLKLWIATKEEQVLSRVNNSPIFVFAAFHSSL